MELNTVKCIHFESYSTDFYLAILNPIRHNSTCYPGIVCDGTETTLTGCKYDRELASTEPEHLYAIITRCIGKMKSFVSIL